MHSTAVHITEDTVHTEPTNTAFTNDSYLKVKIKSLIVNRPSHSSVTNASSAHLHFHGHEPAVCCRRLACSMGSHGITCHPIQANASLPYIWEEGQTSAYYCSNLPGGEAGTNLYCLVNRDTCVWTTCRRSLPGSGPARSQTCNLRVTSLARYC